MNRRQLLSLSWVGGALIAAAPAEARIRRRYRRSNRPLTFFDIVLVGVVLAVVALKRSFTSTHTTYRSRRY